MFGQQLLRGQPLPLLLEALSQAYAQVGALVLMSDDFILNLCAPSTFLSHTTPQLLHPSTVIDPALCAPLVQALVEVVAQRGGPAAQQPYPTQQQEQGTAGATSLADLPTQPYQELLFSSRAVVAPPSSAYQQHLQGQQEPQWPGQQQQQQQSSGSGGLSVQPSGQPVAQLHRGSKRNSKADQQGSRGKTL